MSKLLRKNLGSNNSIRIACATEKANALIHPTAIPFSWLRSVSRPTGSLSLHAKVPCRPLVSGAQLVTPKERADECLGDNTLTETYVLQVVGSPHHWICANGR